eukprot:3459616-Rhodomonas_salina.1
MPCGGGGFAGGGPGCRMSGERNGVRPGFSGGVPGRERCRIFWRNASAQEELGKWHEARRGQRGCWGLFWGRRGQGSSRCQQGEYAGIFGVQEKDEGNATGQQAVAAAFFAMQNQVTI